MGQGASAQLKVSGDVFDWHLVAAVRILCADKEQDLKFKTFEQLGAFNKSQSQDIEVMFPACPVRMGFVQLQCFHTHAFYGSNWC